MTGPPPAPASIVLVGMMASGKTTAGRLLADRLGWDFVDSDAQVEARTGRTVNEVWHGEGEPAYRRLEAAALADALAAARERPAVVAAAGGVVLDPANRKLLSEAGRVVWLRADPATLSQRVLAARVGDHAGHRPLLDGDDGPAAALARLDLERQDLYAEVARATVDVDGLTPDQVVDAVLEAL